MQVSAHVLNVRGAHCELLQDTCVCQHLIMSKTCKFDSPCC